ncbi:Prolyl oligopeptidase family protein [compost metagenome]
MPLACNLCLARYRRWALRRATSSGRRRTGWSYTVGCSRSPIHHADRVKTPTLHVCGALDKITPASQALEFHKALQGSTDVETVLLTYPHEGHGIRNMPAIFDFTARVMYWFERHIPLRPVHRADPDHL